MAASLSRYRALFAQRVPVMVSAALAAAGCGGGSTTDSVDGGDVVVIGMDCGGGPPPQTVTITYDECSVVDAGDAGDAAADAGDASDASADANDVGDAAVEDAGRCFQDCMQACMANGNTGIYPGFATCQKEVSRAGSKVTATCQISRPCGRRLDGLVEPELSHTGMGRVLAECAWLEAASVRSFRRLARELRAHGAPAELVAAADVAARDEVRHARAMARLARKHGAEPPKVRVARVGKRSLEAIALENSVEACVGETYGAALAAWQASRACDPEVKRVLEAIAPDEANHAALAWAVRDWIAGKLDDDANARVRAAERAAIARLRVDATLGDDADVARAVGLPSAVESAALVDAVEREIWAAAA